MIAFDDLSFCESRTAASREMLRALGLFRAPVVSSLLREPELDEWLLVALRTLLACVVGEEDSAFSAWGHLRRHREATDNKSDTQAITDLKSITAVTEEILLGIHPPSFRANPDQTDAVSVLADVVSSVLPGLDGWKSLRYADDALIHFVPPADLDYNIPLWANDDANAKEPNRWILSNQPRTPPLLNYWSYDEAEWEFWQTWYQGFVDGSPIDMELQRRIAGIHDTIWENGLKAVADEIERIRTQWQVEVALSELTDSFEVVTSPRDGIGGNNPPEDIHDELLSGSITLIWEATQELSTALEDEEPSSEWIKAILNKLKSGLAGLLKWSALSTKLAVGTVIVIGSKQVTTAVVDAYIAKHPEKIQTLIEVLERFLPFLR